MADRKILTLKANSGQDECNFGTERFTVDPKTHTVEVPEEAAAPLIAVGGFELITDPAPVPAGMVRVRHPEGVGCSYGGVAYEPAEDGSVMVPAIAVASLLAHGFAGTEIATAPEPAPALGPEA